MAVKKIGIITSGGDAPGMNAAIRAVVRSAIHEGIEVCGVRRGYAGLINDDMFEMSMRSVSDIIQRGGTILYTARSEEFKTPEGQLKAVENLKKNHIDGLVVIGGDGTFTGAKVLSEKYGILTIGLPGTIDNDLAYTDFTLGFDTAVNTVIDAINKLRDTMTSHERVSIVEVMGRHCGDIALYAGISSGAEVIIVPEIPYTVDDVCAKLTRNINSGKHSGIIVLAEGAGKAEDLKEHIKEKIGEVVSIKTAVLGHIQRGGSPTMADRLLAARVGYRAVELLMEGKGNRVVGIHDNKIVDYDIVEALSKKKAFNKKLYDIANIVSL